ncbi:MAG: exodeoxyribonuclease VII small subunit [Pseudomonadota bacterium]
MPADNKAGGEAVAGAEGDIAAMSFERALKELETIVHRLERGDVALEESIAIYERGAVLGKRCEDLLQKAQAKVEKLTLGADGKPTGKADLDPS